MFGGHGDIIIACVPKVLKMDGRYLHETDFQPSFAHTDHGQSTSWTTQRCLRDIQDQQDAQLPQLGIAILLTPACCLVQPNKRHSSGLPLLMHHNLTDPKTA